MADVKKSTSVLAALALSLSLGVMWQFNAADNIDWARMSDNIDWAGSSQNIDWARGSQNIDWARSSDNIDWAGGQSADNIDWAGASVDSLTSGAA